MRKKISMDSNKITFDRGYDGFIMRCRAKNLREGTIQSYEGRIKTIYKFIDYKTPIRDINKNMIDNFIINCKEELKVKDIT